MLLAGWHLADGSVCYASQLVVNDSGRVCIMLGDLDDTDDAAGRFAKRTPPVTELAQADVNRFYQVLKYDLGYGYDGPFRALTEIRRRFSFSTATIQNTAFEDGETDLVFHPRVLDSPLSSLNACSAPDDGRPWSIVAPTYFRRVSLIPVLCGAHITDTVRIDCTIVAPRDDRITGDVDVYLAGYENKIVGIEGVRISLSESDLHQQGIASCETSRGRRVEVALLSQQL